MKLYIAGPMSGLPGENFPAFNALAAQLRQRGHTVINPAELLPVGTPRAQCMKVDLPLLVHCEAIVLLPGWEVSDGATHEFKTALMCGLESYDAGQIEEIPLTLIPY